MTRRPRAIRPATLTPELIAVWSALLDKAVLLRDLEPWTIINGTSLLGVLDRRSGDIDWCSVMGQGGQLFGVAVYPGDRGLASHQRILRDKIDRIDAHIAQVAVVLSYNDKDMVGEDMRAVLKACGRRYRGRNSWPEMLIHEPGFLQTPPMELATVERITRVIDALIVMTELAYADPGWDTHDAQDRPWVAESAEEGGWVPRRRAMPTPSDPPLPRIAFDEVAAVRAATKRSQSTVLMDWFSAQAVVDGPEAAGRPYYAIHVVALDLSLGKIIGVETCRLEEAWTELARLLVAVSTDKGVPKKTVVRRAQAKAILAPAAAALGTTLVHDPNTEDVIVEILEGLSSML